LSARRKIDDSHNFIPLNAFDRDEDAETEFFAHDFADEFDQLACDGQAEPVVRFFGW
jgi:hypothetical protein